MLSAQSFGQVVVDYSNKLSVAAASQQLVSTKKGQAIDTAAVRKLCLPTANFTVVGVEDDNFMHETISLNDYLIMLTDPYYTQGYFEQGTGFVEEEYNGIAHIMQSFEGIDSEEESGKGVNSYQLVFSDGRWWIANTIWSMSAEDGKDIPKKYFANATKN